MTLNDIIVSALLELDRGHDAQTLDLWRDKLTHFANDAAADLAYAIKPVRTETVTVTDGAIDIKQLSRRCVKLISIGTDGRELRFTRADTGRVSLADADGVSEAEARYIFLPKELSSATDVPELPDICHGLIVTYAVGRERAAGDVTVQRGGNIYFQMYEAGRRRLRAHLGAPDDFTLTNRW